MSLGRIGSIIVSNKGYRIIDSTITIPFTGYRSSFPKTNASSGLFLSNFYRPSSRQFINLRRGYNNINLLTSSFLSIASYNSYSTTTKSNKTKTTPSIAYIPVKTMISNKLYDDAIEKLNTLQTNAAILDEVRKSRGAMNAKSLPEMRIFLKRMGYEVKRFVLCYYCLTMRSHIILFINNLGHGI